MKTYELQTLPSQILNPALESRLDKSVSVVVGILEFCHLAMVFIDSNGQISGKSCRLVVNDLY
jgi:hypothetical protein